MSKKENVIVFPYDSHFTPLLRYQNFNDSYNVVCLSSFPGWGLCGKDAGYADGGSEINLLVESRFEECFDNCDTVIFTDSDNYIEYESVVSKMFTAVEAGKNVISLIKLDARLEEIEAHCKNRNVYFRYYRKNNSNHHYLYPKIGKEGGLLEISTPIIAIIGISENTHKFALQLELRKHLNTIGYNALLVGSRPYCEFLGYKSFPEFMSDINISESDKIYLFNRYIKGIEMEEKPDVIIIGVPGGIIPYNNRINNNFGITAFEVFQSVIPDLSVLSILHEIYMPEYFKLISDVVKHRFGFDIDFLNITNRQIDHIEMASKPEKIKYVTLNSNFIDKRILKYKEMTDIPIYNVLNSTDSYKLAETIVNNLAYNENGLMF